MKKYSVKQLFIGILTVGFIGFSQPLYAQKNNSQTTYNINKKDVLTILEKNRAFYQKGKVADYIPE